ncbi:MAG TPA: Crp/Fnr family transcriptional regulator [Cyclobacteriaceae bacterium]|nr:Crp/Fnr family transcriptional regulator [Cyclobacteriaceae bacterium]
MASAKKVHLQCLFCKGLEKSLFCGLSNEELNEISENKTCVTYKKGQTLFYEGTRPMGLFCVNSGKIKVSRMSSQGKEYILRISSPGDFLGYRALLSEEHYAASATVIEDAQVCFIPKSDFLKTLQKNPAFFERMMKAVCHELGVLEERVADLAQKSVRERLAGTLIMLKDTYGLEKSDHNKPDLIDLALSREDLASIVGTATETVIRLLSEFKNDGLISMEGKKIKVLDVKKLAKEADFYA